jgi:hypothetical protein
MSVFLALIGLVIGTLSCLIPFTPVTRSQLGLIDSAAGIVFAFFAYVIGADSALVIAGLVAGRVIGIPRVCRGGNGLLLLAGGALFFSFIATAAAGIVWCLANYSTSVKRYAEVACLALFICSAPVIESSIFGLDTVQVINPVWWSIAATAALVGTTLRLQKSLTV